MPTYEYRCGCGREFETFQRMSDPPVASCPDCGAEAERLISGGAGLLFRGEGFYITDHRSEDYRKRAREESGGGEADAKKGARGEKGAKKADAGKGDGAKGAGASGREAGKGGGGKGTGAAGAAGTGGRRGDGGGRGGRAPGNGKGGG